MSDAAHATAPRKAVPMLRLLLAALAPLALACDAPRLAAWLHGAAAGPAIQAAAGAPIPTGGASAVDSPDARVLDAWYERNFLAAYRRVGQRSPKWDADAEAFIRASAAGMLYGSRAGSVAHLVARGRSLRDAGCDDPMILYLAGRAEYEADPESPESSELFERAFAGIGEAAYPRAVAFRAVIALDASHAERNDGTGKATALAPVELRWFVDSLDDGSYGPDEDVVVVRHLSQGPYAWFFSRNRAAIVAALERRAWVDPWVRHLFAGERELDDAWDARGSASAREVSSAGWEGMEASLAVARRELSASWEARRDRPEAAATMITVAKAAPQAAAEPRLWFDRAVTAQFDYEKAYLDLIEALRVRWGGDAAALPAFAAACAATRRFETVVPLMAFRAIEQMEFDVYDEVRPHAEVTREHLAFPAHRRPPSPYRDAEIYATVATVLERYEREPAQQDRGRYRSLQAVVAYKAARYEDARRFLRAAGGTLRPEARRAVEEGRLEARIEAYAAADGAATRRAEALYLDGRAPEAVPLFEQALAGAVDAAHPYLAQRLAAAAMEKALAAGERTRFLPAPGLAGWTPTIGEWAVEPGGALLGKSAAKGLFIVADARVGPDFELDADIEVAATTNGQFQAGVLFGESPSFGSARWSSFRLKNTAHEGQVVYFSKHFAGPVHVIKRTVPRRNRIRIRSWKGRLSAWIDGEEVVRDYAPEWTPPFTDAVQVGFGAYVDDNRFSVRYRDVTLRRLTAPPPATEPSGR